jgi:hypothetical protein
MREEALSRLGFGQSNTSESLKKSPDSLQDTCKIMVEMEFSTAIGTPTGTDVSDVA